MLVYEKRIYLHPNVEVGPAELSSLSKCFTYRTSVKGIPHPQED